MNTVVVMLVGSFTVSWWLARNVVRHRPRTSKNFYAVSRDPRGADSDPATSESESPIRKRFLELRGETAAIIERYGAMQSQLNEQLARELSSVREQLERLQQDASANLETLDPTWRAGAMTSFFKRKN